MFYIESLRKNVSFLRDVKNKKWVEVKKTDIAGRDVKFLHPTPNYFKVGTKLYYENWGYRGHFDGITVYTIKRYTPKGAYILVDDYERETKVYAYEIGEEGIYSFAIRERIKKKMKKQKEISAVEKQIEQLKEHLAILNQELHKI